MRYVELRGRNRPSILAVVDDEDYERVMAAGPWFGRERKHTTYVIHHVGKGEDRITEALHTFLGYGMTDHKDHDGLNNRRSNLREVTHTQNMWNRLKSKGHSSSAYKGVYWNRPRRLWIASIKVDGKVTHLGGFVDEVAAALAYDKAARELFGEYAGVNFP
jgi:hypothetical protein